MPGFDTIKIQTEGIVMALSEFVPKCGNTRISYFSWGTNVHQVSTADVRDEVSRLALAMNVHEENTLDLSATHHTNTWNEIRHLSLPSERTTIVFITNGRGHAGVFEEIPGTTVHKVALTFTSADEYLRSEFLPGVGTNHFLHKSEDLRDVILAALEDLDIPCTG